MVAFKSCVNGILRYVVTVVVRGPEGITLLDSGPRQKDRKATRVMIPPVIGRGQLALRVNRPAELPAPNDQGILEQSALTKIGNQGRGRLVGVPALSLDCVGQTPVVVPTHVKELDAANVSLRHAAGKQAIRGIGPGLQNVRSIAVEDMLGFLGNVGQVGHARLHAESHLVLGNTGVDLRIANHLPVLAVQLGDLVEHIPAHLAVDALRIG